MFGSGACVWILFALLHGVVAWDQDQLEVFDVVEEVDRNFYELMNITAEANSTQIRKAFRNLSLLLHPDKNAALDADVQFRNLVAVYEVLKDPNKRKHYDDVLVNGLPKWHSAVYYYRHYRKMGVTEMLAILFVLITIGQYLIGWASYFEKKYTFEQVYQSKLEKKKKKLSKKGQNVEEILEAFEEPKPSFRNTLPFQLPRLVYCSIVAIPSAFRVLGALRKEQELRKARELQEQESVRQLELEAEQKRLRDKELRRRKQAAFQPAERGDDELPPPPVSMSSPCEEECVPLNKRPAVSGGLWTDDDLAELVHLVKRYPGGSTDRWERIAEWMGRSVGEVTYMAAKLKENCYRVPGGGGPEADNSLPGAAPEELPRKQKTRGGKALPSGPTDQEPEWTQLQQKALETALAKHPKGPADRWDKIAKCVPDKTKEECILRYKHLVELVKKKKETTDEPSPEQVSNC